MERLAYRREIDGLRAIAVVSVILFHTGIGYFAGGFLGVDVFFVISGYLITRIIKDEILAEQFSLLNFYERRTRRILPALYLVCFITILCSWVLLFPSEYQDYSASLSAVPSFWSNILFRKQSGYFSAPSDLKPLLHTWSLSVEEQYYVLFPLMTMIAVRFRVNLFLVYGLVFVSSLSWAEYISGRYPSENFFLIQSRGWELLTGAILAINYKNPIRIVGNIRQIPPLFFMATMAWSFYYFDETTVFPSMIGVIPVAGVAGLIAFATADTWVGKALGSRILVSIGLISYSAYLWHQPLFAYARIVSIKELSSLHYGLLIATVFVLAYLSWRFVERPFRRRNFLARGHYFLIALTVTLLFIGYGAWGYFNDGLPSRLSSKTLATLIYAKGAPTRLFECAWGLDGSFLKRIKNCSYNNQLPIRTVVFGDSHGAALTDALATRLLEREEGLLALTLRSCPPATEMMTTLSPNDECHNFNLASMEYILNAGIDNVVLVARWAFYIEGTPFDNKNGWIEDGPSNYGLPLGRSMDDLTDDQRVSFLGERFRQTVLNLLSAGKRVILVYPIPEVGRNVPESMARGALLGRPEFPATEYKVFTDRVARAYRELDQLPQHPMLARIYPERHLCNVAENQGCIFQQDGKPLYFDDDHLNRDGAGLIVEDIMSVLIQGGS